jgi:hypothetical protein
VGCTRPDLAIFDVVGEISVYQADSGVIHAAASSLGMRTKL